MEHVLSYQLGDFIFSRQGTPGLIVDRRPADRSIEVKEEGQAFEKARTYGYINGLSPKDRNDYQVIIDQNREQKTPYDRVLHLQEKINDLKGDPQKLILQRYLESELAHIMNSDGVRLVSYEVNLDQLIK